MAELDRSKLCFDIILLRKQGDNYNPMPIHEFADLPVDERIRLIMDRKIRFFADEVEVPTYDAIQSLDAARR